MSLKNEVLFISVASITAAAAFTAFPDYDGVINPAIATLIMLGIACIAVISAIALEEE